MERIEKLTSYKYRILPDLLISNYDSGALVLFSVNLLHPDFFLFTSTDHMNRHKIVGKRKYLLTCNIHLALISANHTRD